MRFYTSPVMTDLSHCAVLKAVKQQQASDQHLLPDKRQVAASFSRAAASYDSVADLQRAVGTALITRLPDLTPSRWLDLGSGRWAAPFITWPATRRTCRCATRVSI
jgi:malonyl-CoA O-methyltransferase